MSSVTKKVRKVALYMSRQCWEQGILSYAMLCTGKHTVQDMMTHDMVVRQSSDGRLCNVENTPAVTDSSFCMPAVLESGQRLGREDYVKAAHRNAEYLLHDAERTQEGVLYHIKGTCQIWADSAAFLPYALSITGHPAEAFDQMQGLLDRLYLPDKGMYAHILDAAEGRYPDGNAWGIGNGWILTGLLRTALSFSREDERRRKLLLDRFTALAGRMLEFMTPEGAFHDVLDDPSTYLETETASMTACALYRACRAGVLDASFLDKAEKIRGYVLTKIDDRGLVLDSAGSPDYLRPGTSVESQAHVLLMENERNLNV